MFRMRTGSVPMKLKEAIMILKNENKTIRDISQTLGLPKSTVWNIIKKEKCTGELANRKGTGRPRKTTAADDGKIITMIKEDPRTTVRQVRNSLLEAGVNLSDTTIRRRLHGQKYRGYTAKLEPLVCQENGGRFRGWRHEGEEEEEEGTRRVEEKMEDVAEDQAEKQKEEEGATEGRRSDGGEDVVQTEAQS